MASDVDHQSDASSRWDQIFQFYSPEGAPATAKIWSAVWIPKRADQKSTTAVPEKKLWLVYIHGGAWRDPEVDALSFNSTLSCLDPVKSGIAGVISINYRLSPYPSHPRNPSGRDDPTRNAKHPDHLKDVYYQIHRLQEKYRFGHNYILIGHSCGATLALQTCSVAQNKLDGINTDYDVPKITLPLTCLGVEGIYDIPLLVETHASIPIYRTFTEDAFGNDEVAWLRASPVNMSMRLANVQDVIIAHSPDDELVELEQASIMLNVLQKQMLLGCTRSLTMTHGTHQEVWQNGSELAGLIETAITSLAIA